MDGFTPEMIGGEIFKRSAINTKVEFPLRRDGEEMIDVQHEDNPIVYVPSRKISLVRDIAGYVPTNFRADPRETFQTRMMMLRTLTGSVKTHEEISAIGLRIPELLPKIKRIRLDAIASERVPTGPTINEERKEIRLQLAALTFGTDGIDFAKLVDVYGQALTSDED